MMAFVDRHVRSSLFDTAFWSVIAVALYVIAFTLGPALESKFLPVYSYFRVVDAVKVSDNSVRLRVSYTKLRDCEVDGFSWYLGTRGGEYRRLHVNVIRPANDHGGRSPVGGVTTSDPFEVDASPLEIQTMGLFADVYSRCHPLWQSTTEVYPDPQAPKIIDIKEDSTFQ